MPAFRDKMRANESVEHYETTRRTKDGRTVEVEADRANQAKRASKRSPTS